MSDTEESNPKKLANGLVRQKMANPLLSDDDDDEEKEQTDIEDIVKQIHINDVVPVRVADINNPMKFWLHVRLQKYTHKINKLLEELQ